MDMYVQAQPIMRFRQFTERDENFGANRGNTLLFDKNFNVDTEGGPLNENQPFPKTGYRTKQGSVVATEYGNSIPYTEKLERLSKFNLSDNTHRAIINDMAKTMNRAAHAPWPSTKIYYTPKGTTTPSFYWKVQTGNVTDQAATRSIGVTDLIAMREALASGVYITTFSAVATTATASPVPPYDDDGNYMILTSVGGASALRRDSDFINAALYGDPERLFAGEIGRFHGFRIVEENHILSNFLGTQEFKGEMYAFGTEVVKEIVILPEEIRRGVPLDGGRDKAFYWYGIVGFGLIWSFNGTVGDVSNYEPENRAVRVWST